MRERLGQFLLQHSEPAAVPAMYPFLKQEDDIRQLTLSPKNFLPALRTEFTDPQLTAARVLCPGQQTASRDPFDPLSAQRETCSGSKLTPVLVASPLIFERDNDRVLDITSDAGTLWQRDPPALRVVLERRPPQRHARELFVAESAAVPVLRRLRLPVVSIAGLAELNGPQMRQLFARQSKDEGPYYRVTIVAWNLGGLTNELSEYPQRAMQRIHNWQLVRAYDPEQTLIQAWAPGTKQFEKIKIAVEFGDVQLIRLMILESVRTDAKNAVDAWQALVDSRDVSLSMAVNRLRAAIAQGPGGLNRKDAKLAARAYRKRIYAIINECYRNAEAARNPAEALHWQALAREQEEFLSEQPLLIAADQIAAGQPARSQKLDAATTLKRDQQIARLLQVTKPLSNKR